jgi:hypothetical protein
MRAVNEGIRTTSNLRPETRLQIPTPHAVLSRCMALQQRGDGDMHPWSRDLRDLGSADSQSTLSHRMIPAHDERRGRLCVASWASLLSPVLAAGHGGTPVARTKPLQYYVFGTPADWLDITSPPKTSSRLSGQKRRNAPNYPSPLRTTSTKLLSISPGPMKNGDYI